MLKASELYEIESVKASEKARICIATSGFASYVVVLYDCFHNLIVKPHMGVWSNGKTTVSKAVNRGSIPLTLAGP